MKSEHSPVTMKRQRRKIERSDAGEKNSVSLPRLAYIGRESVWLRFSRAAAWHEIGRGKYLATNLLPLQERMDLWHSN
jgi:hypothetical protein